jgi:hypothetical protein
MALPPLELFSLKKKPPCCRVAFSLHFLTPEGAGGGVTLLSGWPQAGLRPWRQIGRVPAMLRACLEDDPEWDLAGSPILSAERTLP